MAELIRPIQPWQNFTHLLTAVLGLIQIRYDGSELIHKMQVALASNKFQLTLTDGTETLKLAGAVASGFTVVNTVDELLFQINNSALKFKARRLHCPVGFDLTADNACAAVTEKTVGYRWEDAMPAGSAAKGMKRLCNYDWAQENPNTGVFTEKTGMLEFASVRATGVAETKGVSLCDDEGNVIHTAVAGADGIVDFSDFIAAGSDCAIRGPLLFKTDSATGSLFVRWRPFNR